MLYFITWVQTVTSLYENEDAWNDAEMGCRNKLTSDFNGEKENLLVTIYVRNIDTVCLKLEFSFSKIWAFLFYAWWRTSRTSQPPICKTGWLVKRNFFRYTGCLPILWRHNFFSCLSQRSSPLGLLVSYKH